MYAVVNITQLFECILLDIVIHISCVVSTAFCDSESTISIRGNYQWPKSSAETKLTISCTYMGNGNKSECNIVVASLTRYCNAYGVWEEPDVSTCYTSVTLQLCNIRNVRN